MVTRNFPPLIGGMERLNYHVFLELAREYSVGLVGPFGANQQIPSNSKIWRCPPQPLYMFFLSAAFSTVAAAIRTHPQIVFAGSGLTAPVAYIAGRLSSARLFLYLHGLDIEVKHRLYRNFWRPIFKRFDRVLVNSNFTKDLAENAGIPCSRITILRPGVDLPDLRNWQEKRRAFRRRYNLGDKPLMLYVGRITARKGLRIFVKEILPQILKALPMARLVVIGDNPSFALLNTGSEVEAVRKILLNTGLSKSVIFLGEVSDNELNEAYFAADVLIFPVQAHPYDNEGFGMVAVEAAAHGLPTVAFAAGGVPDAVADGISGRLIPANDNTAFATAVTEILFQHGTHKLRGSCRRFAEQFGWSAFGEKLRKIVFEMLERTK